MKSLSKICQLLIVSLCIVSCEKNRQASATRSFLDSDTVSVATAKKYVRNYQRHAGTVDSVIGSGLTRQIIRKPDTRCVWFGIDRLQKMIERVKAEGGDGVRFYLATYDSTYKASTNDAGHIPQSKYWGYNTLIMVSTKDSLKIYHRDYYKNFIEDPAIGNKNLRRGFIVTITPENRGELCPPPHDCNDQGATLISIK